MESEKTMNITEQPKYLATNIMLVVFFVVSILCMFISLPIAVVIVLMDALVIIEILGQRSSDKHGFVYLAPHIILFFGVIMILVNLWNLVNVYTDTSFHALLGGIFLLLAGSVGIVNRWEFKNWRKNQEHQIES